MVGSLSEIGMEYNFDQMIDRLGTSCMKFDGYGELRSDYDTILPMWIADMDFATPPFIIDAIKKRLEHPVLGYTAVPDHYYEAIQKWFAKKYGFTPDKEELAYTPGIVSGIYKLVECLTSVGDPILIMPPVYYPFASVINATGRLQIEAPLIIKDHQMEIDWERLDAGLQEAKLFVLCHPHNPGGRIWRIEELERIAEMAARHDTIVISDEIHADLTLNGVKHYPFVSVSPQAAEVGVTLMAPSKAFNMPGLISSHYYIKNRSLKSKIDAYMLRNGLGAGACYIYDATAAAYNEGEEWLAQCLTYIEGNIRFVQDYLADRIPEISMIVPEASFLVFLNCEKLGFETTEDLVEFFVQKAGLLLNDGKSFGTGGAFYMRLNVGAPRGVIEEAMKRLETAVATIRK